MDSDNPIIVLLMLAVALFVVYLVVMAALSVVGITVAVGTAFGGGVSLYNYVIAFKNNVKMESPIT
jgi:hypothetical protein